MKLVIFKVILGLLTIFVLGNLLFLDWKLFSVKKEQSEKITTETLSTPIPAIKEECPDSCLGQIYEATSSLNLVAPMTQIAKTASGEFFISFGSGSTKANDWEDVVGLGAYIDSTKYGKIKTISFEASVNIPNGNQGVYVRLFNVTDKHPVWFSEVFHEGGLPKLLISPPITLDSGNKFYQVQMKTTLKDTANLNQARVKITTE